MTRRRENINREPEVVDGLARQLPQAPDSERAVLGSILTVPKCLVRVTSIVVPDDFFRDAHRTIYEVILELDNEGITIDTLSVKEELARKGMLEAVGGHSYVSALMDGVPDTANVERYARTVRVRADARRIIVKCYAGAKRAWDNLEPPDDIASDLVEQLQMVKPADLQAALLDVSDVAQRVYELYDKKETIKGYSTGWPVLDSLYTVQRGAWTVVTGIPSHGKSGVVDNLALNLASLHGWNGVIYSAENYPPEDYIPTLIEKYLGEPFDSGTTAARMQRHRLAEGMKFLQEHLRIIDASAEGITLDRLLALTAGLHDERPVDFLVIDPWNQLQHNFGKEISEALYISDSLAKLRRWARRMDAHIFVVAHPTKMQKNKDTLKYDVPRPYDINGGAAWYNNADYAFTVYRNLTDAEDLDTAIYVQKIRRRRLGRIGQCFLRYDKVTGGYYDPNARRPRMVWEK